MAETVIVSACLVGIRCRYDGAHALDEKLVEALDGFRIVPLCPEQLGGLSTPRDAAGICGGDGFQVLDGMAFIRTLSGEELTAQFIRGAKESLKIARLVGAGKAYLKEKSPSCGVNVIKKKGVEVSGSGVAAALFRKEGIEVVGVL